MKTSIWSARAAKAARGRTAAKPSVPIPVPILALDVATLAEAERFLDRLKGLIGFYKVGLRLFSAEGPRAVDAVKKRGGKVFLDLKLHDIPQTVAGAVESAAGLGVDAVSLHLSGGKAMCEAAQAVPRRPLLWGVTVLTSLSVGDLAPLGGGTPLGRALSLAREFGPFVDGLVASGKEVDRLRGLGIGKPLIVPGIRPHGVIRGDQKRVITPQDAARLGIEYVVVGRPILEAPEPVEAARQLLAALGGGGA